MCWCACVHVARKQRVETYLDHDTVEQITELAKARGVSSSAIVRNAVRSELDSAEELDT